MIFFIAQISIIRKNIRNINVLRIDYKFCLNDYKFRKIRMCCNERFLKELEKKKGLMYSNRMTSITIFAIYVLKRPKIGLPNLFFHQFSYSERLIHSKRHLKRSLCIEFKEIVRTIFYGENRFRNL